MRILLAEDDSNISFVTRLALERVGGHSVVICKDGQEALDCGLREAFDLYVLDGMMPRLSGVQVAHRLRMAGITGTPILFLSAKSDRNEIAAFLEIGDGYIPKPFNPQLICEQIESLLRGTNESAA